MAFAFSLPDHTISNAIRRAKGNRDRLFFAAASNNKYYSEDPVGFPANLDDVIRVNSCSHSGSRSSFSPHGNEKGDSLGTIGEEMPAAVPRAEHDAAAGEGEQRMRGTSVATAVLTGIAALVIEFSRLGAAPRIDTNRPPEEVTAELLTNTGMKRVLYHCLAGTNPPAPPEYSYVRPWLLFQPRNQEIAASKIREAMTKKL
jgi:subtilisin family serine protease